ncbi:hypothetical protein B0H13DRAFT_1865142 [Mycena leptocephala]|nr:hypothetical protein B0H13DRAFT_1865142 [Mycena leptocephala]
MEQVCLRGRSRGARSVNESDTKQLRKKIQTFPNVPVDVGFAIYEAADFKLRERVGSFVARRLKLGERPTVGIIGQTAEVPKHHRFIAVSLKLTVDGHTRLERKHHINVNDNETTTRCVLGGELDARYTRVHMRHSGEGVDEDSDAARRQRKTARPATTYRRRVEDERMPRGQYKRYSSGNGVVREYGVNDAPNPNARVEEGGSAACALGKDGEAHAYGARRSVGVKRRGRYG